MKYYILLALLFISSLNLYSQDTNCTRSTTFGGVEICLPIIEGYQESYEDPIVKQLADGTEMPTNEVLGFYLNDAIHAKKDSLGLLSFDDYFKVYATKQLATQVSDKKFLMEVRELIGGQFIAENWDQMEQEIDKLGHQVEVGVPKIIKSYTIDDESFTYIMMTKYEVPGGEPYTLVMSMNGINLHDRLVWMAHYLEYNGEESIKEIQEKSNHILSTFISVNN